MEKKSRRIGSGLIGFLGMVDSGRRHCRNSRRRRSHALARREEISRKLGEFLNESSSLVVDMDSETALVWARLRHSHEVKRQPQALWDSLIDAMAVRHGIPVAPRNEADFRHAATLNPWTA